jgi:hypothetical protein
MVWNVAGKEPEKVAKETTFSLGDFANANAWIVNEIIGELEK